MVVRQCGMVAAGAGLYFLFAGQFSISELLAGVLPVCLASIFAWRWSRITRQGFFLQGPWGKILVATLWAVPRDAFKVGMVLVKILVKPPSGAVGSLVRQALRTGGKNKQDAGRRAILVLANSLAPNGIVFELDNKNGIILHRLAKAEPSADTEWPL